MAIDLISYRFDEGEFMLHDERGVTFGTVSGEAVWKWDGTVGEFYLATVTLDTPACTSLTLHRREVTQPRKWLSECLFPQIERDQGVSDFVSDQVRDAA